MKAKGKGVNWRKITNKLHKIVVVILKGIFIDLRRVKVKMEDNYEQVVNLEKELMMMRALFVDF